MPAIPTRTSATPPTPNFVAFLTNISHLHLDGYRRVLERYGSAFRVAMRGRRTSAHYMLQGGTI